MNYRKARNLSLILVLLGIFASLFLFAFEEITALFIALVVISLALIICSCVVTIKFYRCPHCHVLLPIRSAPREYCPSCGKKLGL